MKFHSQKRVNSISSLCRFFLYFILMRQEILCVIFFLLIKNTHNTFDSTRLFVEFAHNFYFIFISVYSQHSDVVDVLCWILVESNYENEIHDKSWPPHRMHKCTECTTRLTAEKRQKNWKYFQNSHDRHDESEFLELKKTFASASITDSS